VTACFISTSVANCLPARCCLRCLKRWPGFGATTECLWTNLLPRSYTLRFPPLGLLKKYLARKRFTTDVDMKEPITSWLQTLDDFSYAAIPALVLQREKCLNVKGDYGEVSCVISTTHMRCKHRRQHKVLGIRACFLPKCLKLPCASTKNKMAAKRIANLFSSHLYFRTTVTQTNN
jgi:hypothetical protein